MRGWMRSWAVLGTTLAAATNPDVAFPFNSQVPTVARVGQPYTFQFSSSTFIPYNTNFTYSLSNQPAWLQIDSATGTLTGQPSAADAGAPTFTITAADIGGVAHMPCTLVVSADPAPQIEGNIAEDLAATANLSSSDPPVVTIMPSTAFRFAFKQGSFIDIVQRQLYYYATMTDHTPLPSWLQFDITALAFSGTTPNLSAVPQSWEVDLIASDVLGFSGTSVSFTIAIGTQQLVFVPEQQEVRMTAGQSLNFSGLQNTLFFNGVQVAPSSLESATASTPSWLNFDATTLALSGVAPQDVDDFNITVNVVDAQGDQAAAVVTFATMGSSNTSLFAGTVGTLVATSGQPFSYHLSNSLFSDPNENIQVIIPGGVDWLTYNSDTRVLSGTVPKTNSPSSIQIILSASASGSSIIQSQTFVIDVKPETSTTTYSSLTPSYGSKTISTSSVPTQSASKSIGHQSKSHLKAGVIAGTVVGVLAAVGILVLCLCLCCRRRRRARDGYVETGSPGRRDISQPILPPDENGIAVTTQFHRDVEKLEDYDIPPIPEKQPEPAPQIALDLPAPSTNKRMKWSKHWSRISQASSIGNGEPAIRADSNIPELGTQAEALQAPHDSFSVPAEIARSSRLLMDSSPTKRARRARRSRDERNSRQDVGLGIDTSGKPHLPRHSSGGQRKQHRRGRSSMGLSGTLEERSSVGSMSTRNTSMLTDFPHPPTTTTRSSLTASQSLSTHLSADAKRRSIRMVARTGSSAGPDTRPLEKKRDSYIRNRASHNNIESPLFSHGSRASSSARKGSRSSKDMLSAGSQRRSHRGKSQLSTYSESSSLEPQPLTNSRQLSKRLKTAIPDGFPRAVTKSSMGADDEDSIESKSSDYEDTSEPISEDESEERLASQKEEDWIEEMALPRNQRGWVLPGEASPTPPPSAPHSFHQTSAGAARRPTPASANERLKQRFKQPAQKQFSSSPLATGVAMSVNTTSPEVEAGGSFGTATRSMTAKVAAKKKRNRLSEPIELVSSDSLSRGKQERPRLVQTASKRPVSVEKVERLSSLKAETEDARPGSEMFEALEGAGLMPSKSLEGGLTSHGVGEGVGTQRSTASGPAFL